MQRKLVLKNYIQIFLSAIVPFLLSTFLFSCSAELIVGDEKNIVDEINNSRSTLFTFYEEDPIKNSNAKALSKRYSIGSEISAESFFPGDLKPGFKATKWIYCDLKNAQATPPKNVRTYNDIIKSINVTIQPLGFYAQDWIGEFEASYTVLHKRQNKDLKVYSVYEREHKAGLPGTKTPTSNFIREYPGFVYKSCTEEIISENETTEVSIYYDRKYVSITINSEAGTFVDDSTRTSVVLEGYYGTTLYLPSLFKEKCNIVGFINDKTGEEIETLYEFGTENASYTVHWEEVGKVRYKVRHLLQKITNNNPYYYGNVEFVGDVETIMSGEREYYTYYIAEKETYGYEYPGKMTNAQFATAELIANIENYTPKSSAINQMQIASDGSTVVDIYYNVKPFEITLDANGGNGTPIKQTFYTETDCITLQRFDYIGFSMENKFFAGWNTNSDGSGINYNDGETLSFTSEPETPITLYAKWGAMAKYTVRHYTQEITTYMDSSIGAEGSTGTITSGGRTYYTYYDIYSRDTYRGFAGEQTKAEFFTNTNTYNRNYFVPRDDSIEQQTISADGSTVVDIYYDLHPIEVTLNPNGGTGSNKTQMFYTQTGCIAIESIRDLGFKKANSYFVGWNTNADGSGNFFADGTSLSFNEKPSKPITLYAQWRKGATSGGSIILPEISVDLSFELDSISGSGGTITVTAKNSGTSIPSSEIKWTLELYQGFVPTGTISNENKISIPTKYQKGRYVIKVMALYKGSMYSTELLYTKN